ncbi:ATP-dependent RNA helicase HrpA [Methyloversatilis sp. XJ19-13]|nr:ATP-dependent RNA helicase HrpA [Methyloversatilis sp. XJ19-13]MCQ9373049.1 ATP-dependent RNA helicase HrpA [Methyloversatilis sp. XJ19-13]
MTVPRPDLNALLESCMSRDAAAIGRALRELPPGQRTPDKWPAKLAERVAASQAKVAARRASAPKIEYPEELPVSARRDEIAAALQAHQVIIVCGETGSGKTTQLPKLCLELGRGARGLIGHTQPRRIAARATADRVAKELNVSLGREVGFAIRFTDRTSEDSRIKLMTDGILLAETQRDRWLAAYDTLIIDEAHERSLNIDFLLGYLREVLPRRPDLKVIVTSATLDAERFANHFAQGDTPAPVIEVSGRLYPIEMRWRPFEAQKDRDLYDAVCDAVDEAFSTGPGDVLVFMPGEREIREGTEALRKHHTRLAGVKPEVLALYARQSAQEQARVFQGSNGRRVILATNVAETSLTVPGIRYVIDTGLARVKRYSYRNKVEQLQVEPIAQSAAKQRAGRCGRVSSGVCFRLYDEEDFNQRPAHTDPEILRSSLAGVILRMKSLSLADVEEFPFIDRPAPRAIADGYQLLQELGAVDEARDLTPLGRELAKLPVDPRVARMILAARDHGALKEVLVITAGLSVQDPRDRPEERAGAADQAHAKFADERSEFLWYLKAWAAFDAVWHHQSQSKQREWCRANFLNWMRMREWRDVHTQLHTLCAEHEWKENERPAEFDALHRALLTGLLGNLGLRIEDARAGEPPYLGARGIKFWPHPGSALAKKGGKWIMTAELVETTRLFARCIARIEPEWVEEVGAHLLRRSTYEPHWSKSRGETVAWERSVIHGITLYAKRAVQYGKTDPVLARELLIREGLVNGDVTDIALKQMKFLQHNLDLIAQIERLEEKQRRQDLLVDESLIHAFYDSIVPADVIDLRGFERWRRDAERENPKLLYLTREQLMRHEAAGVSSERFPAKMDLLGQRLKLEYRHEPNAADDGVTLTVPLTLLNQIPAARLDWLVPGLIEEKVLQLAKTIPPKLRHRLQPVAGFVADFIAQEHDQAEPLVKALARAIELKVSLKLPSDAIRAENLPAHLMMNVRVVDEHGRVLGQSRNLAELRTRLKDEVARRFESARIALPPAASVADASRVLASELASAQASAPAAAHNDAVTAKAATARGSMADALSALGARDVVAKAPVPQPTRKGRAAAEPAAPAVAEQTAGDERYRAWTFGPLPELMEVEVAGRRVIGFPALQDEGESVSLRVLDTPEAALEVHRRGLRRLFALELRDQVKYIEKSLPGLRDMAMQYMNLGTEPELRAQLVAATMERCCMMEPWPQDAASFAARRDEARPRISLVAQEIGRLAGSVLTEYAALSKKLAALKAHPDAGADMRAQLDALVGKFFIERTPFERLTHYPRYLKAIALRIEKLRTDPERDARALADWQSLDTLWDRERIVRARAGVADPFIDEFRWLLEELRVNLFAQELRTPVPVSVKRLQKIWESRARA